MRPRPSATSATVLVIALSLAGCGSSNTSTKAQVGALASIDFKSVAIKAAPNGVHRIPSAYTCDGTNTAPPLEWGPVPANTGQLVLFVLGVTPGKRSAKYSVEWALAGINPALHHIDAGQIPLGAFLGRTASGKRGYSICPRRGTNEPYVFELYGVRRGVQVSPNFDGLPILTALAHTGSGSVTSSHGAFIARYKRS